MARSAVQIGLALEARGRLVEQRQRLLGASLTPQHLGERDRRRRQLGDSVRRTRAAPSRPLREPRASAVTASMHRKPRRCSAPAGAAPARTAPPPPRPRAARARGSGPDRRRSDPGRAGRRGRSGYSAPSLSPSSSSATASQCWTSERSRRGSTCLQALGGGSGVAAGELEARAQILGPGIARVAALELLEPTLRARDVTGAQQHGHVEVLQLDRPRARRVARRRPPAGRLPRRSDRRGGESPPGRARRPRPGARSTRSRSAASAASASPRASCAEASSAYRAPASGRTSSARASASHASSARPCLDQDRHAAPPGLGISGVGRRHRLEQRQRRIRLAQRLQQAGLGPFEPGSLRIADVIAKTRLLHELQRRLEALLRHQRLDARDAQLEAIGIERLPSLQRGEPGLEIAQGELRPGAQQQGMGVLGRRPPGRARAPRAPARHRPRAAPSRPAPSCRSARSGWRRASSSRSHCARFVSPTRISSRASSSVDSGVSGRPSRRSSRASRAAAASPVAIASSNCARAASRRSSRPAAGEHQREEQQQRFSSAPRGELPTALAGITSATGRRGDPRRRRRGSRARASASARRTRAGGGALRGPAIAYPALPAPSTAAKHQRPTPRPAPGREPSPTRPALDTAGTGPTQTRRDLLPHVRVDDGHGGGLRDRLRRSGRREVAVADGTGEDELGPRLKRAQGRLGHGDRVDEGGPGRRAVEGPVVAVDEARHRDGQS